MGASQEVRLAAAYTDFASACKNEKISRFSVYCRVCMIDDYWNKLLRKSCAYVFLEVIEGYADFTHVSNAITKTFEWSSCELSFDQYQSRTYIDLTYRVDLDPMQESIVMVKWLRFVTTELASRRAPDPYWEQLGSTIYNSRG